MDDPPVTLQRTTHPDGLIVYSFSGELDTYGTRSIEQQFWQQLAAEQTPRIIIDLRQVDYMSSAALSMLLIGAQASARQNVQLILAGLQPFVEEVMQRSNFTQIFEVRQQFP